MKLIVLRNNLKAGLDVIGKISAEGTSALPILKNFLIETFDGKIKLAATNLEIGVTGFINGKVIEHGGISVPLNIFSSIINNLQSERINLEVKSNNLIIETDNYNAKIQGIKKEEFPIIPEINNKKNYLKISLANLKNSLLYITNASRVIESKPEINSVLFDYQVNLLKLAATDSFRLAEKTISNSQFESNIEKKFKIIVPIKTIHEIIRIFKNDQEDVSIYFDSNQILFETEGTKIISRLINGEFPEYQEIIPKSDKTEIIISREQLMMGLKLTGVMTDKFNEVKISVSGNNKNIEIYSMNQNVGENKYLIPAKIKGTASDVIFNWRFFLDGIKDLNQENIVLGLNENQPAVIRPQGDSSCFYVLMPIKS